MKRFLILLFLSAGLAYGLSPVMESPRVSGVDAMVIDGDPTSGKVIYATSDTTAEWQGQKDTWIIALSDETTELTTGTGKVTFRTPAAATVLSVRLSVNTASSSGLPTVDINENGESIFSTALSIDEDEKTSLTATTAAVLSDNSLANDAEITIDQDIAGTGTKGEKLIIYVQYQ